MLKHVLLVGIKQNGKLSENCVQANKYTIEMWSHTDSKIYADTLVQPVTISKGCSQHHTCNLQWHGQRFCQQQIIPGIKTKICCHFK